MSSLWENHQNLKKKKKKWHGRKKSLLHDENHSFLAKLVFLRKSWELEENILDEWSKACFTKRTNIAEFVNILSINPIQYSIGIHKRYRGFGSRPLQYSKYHKKWVTPLFCFPVHIKDAYTTLYVVY